MTRKLCWQTGLLALAAMSLATLSGCQTNVAGMTLPSGHYLEHPPQYFAPSPPYPFPRELASMEAQNALQQQGAQGPLPQRVPAGIAP